LYTTPVIYLFLERVVLKVSKAPAGERRVQPAPA
jgi:hypothetical protein